jgi:hypothetical protein
MRVIMLIELWKRPRGYDKWIQTEAKILSSELTEPEAGLTRSERSGTQNLRDQLQWHSTCVIGWKDAADSFHTASYSVSEISPLFQLYEGQTVSIRYNPVNPSEFYLHELFIDRVSITAANVVDLLVYSTILVAMFIMIWHHFH